MDRDIRLTSWSSVYLQLCASRDLETDAKKKSELQQAINDLYEEM